MNLKTILERQELIEELYLELENLIGNKKGYDNNKIEELNYSNFSPSIILTPSKNKNKNLIFPRTNNEWKSLNKEDKNKFKLNLINELKKKKLELINSLEKIEKILM